MRFTSRNCKCLFGRFSYINSNNPALASENFALCLSKIFEHGANCPDCNQYLDPSNRFSYSIFPCSIVRFNARNSQAGDGRSPHYAALQCYSCGRWLKWLSKPKDAFRQNHTVFAQINKVGGDL